MKNIFIASFCSNMIIFDVFISLVVLLLSLVYFYYSSVSSKQGLIKDLSAYVYVKYILVLELSVFFILNMYAFIVLSDFLKKVQTNILFNNSVSYLYYYYSLPINIFSYSLTLDLIGLIFSTLAFFVGFVSLLALDTRFYWNNVKFVFICNILVLTIFLFVTTNNYLVFFICYELLLIPSFLFVYYISPGKQSTQASLYFVIWTQVGSFLVFLAIVYLLNLTGGWSFDTLRTFTFTKVEETVILYLLFFGFGFKVPIWPFHYWITKTHVEAPTGFSIFLSGFLVKSAVYGFYKLNTLLGGSVDTTIFTTFSLLGVIDASLKMWGQTDLKKLVAYATIQEMGIIYVVFCYGDMLFIYGGVLFCITHAFLSSIFFFFVDCVNRRYNSRNIVEINGILHITPNLAVYILIGCILYSGLPGTLKFISELYVFVGLLESSPLSTTLIIFTANFLGLVGFCKVWYNAVFGMTPITTFKLPKDLSIKEIYILCICFLGLTLFGIWVPTLF